MEQPPGVLTSQSTQQPQNAILNNWFDVGNELAELKESVPSSDPPTSTLRVLGVVRTSRRGEP